MLSCQLNILVSITTRSPSALLQIKGLATKYTSVKWPIRELRCICNQAILPFTNPGFLCQFCHFPFCSFLSLMNQRSYLHEREGNHVIVKMSCIKFQIIELYLWKWHIALHFNIMAIWNYLYLGIQQWCLDSDANSSLHKEDEIDSLQCSLNAAPKMKVPGCLSVLISAEVKFIKVHALHIKTIMSDSCIATQIHCHLNSCKNMWMSGLSAVFHKPASQLH